MVKRSNQVGEVYPNSQMTGPGQYMNSNSGNSSMNLGNGLLPPPQMPPMTANASHYGGGGMYGMMPPGSMIPSMNGAYNPAGNHGLPPGTLNQSMPPPPPPPPQHHQHHMAGLYPNPTQMMPPTSSGATAQISSQYNNMYSQMPPTQGSVPQSNLIASSHMHPGSSMMPVNANYPQSIQSIQPGLFPTPPPPPPPTHASSNTVNTATTPNAFSYPPLYNNNPPPNPSYDPYGSYPPPMYNNGMPGLAGPAPMPPMGAYNGGNGLKDPSTSSILGIDPPRVGNKPMYAPSSNQVRPSALKSVNLTNRTS